MLYDYVYRLTHVAVDVVPTRQSGSVHILYIAGTDGTVRKMSIVPRSSRTSISNRDVTTTCLLEVLEPIQSGTNSTNIHTMKFLKETVSWMAKRVYEYAMLFVLTLSSTFPMYHTEIFIHRNWERSDSSAGAPVQPLQDEVVVPGRPRSVLRMGQEQSRVLTSA